MIFTRDEFITRDEQRAIARWFDDTLYDDTVFAWGINDKSRATYFHRRTTRRREGASFPDVVHDVLGKVRDCYGKFNLQNLSNENGHDGIIAIAHLPGGETYLHTDPGDRGGWALCTFNIVIQAAETGGELYLGNPLIKYGTPERALHCYAPTRHQHYVTPTGGERNRYLLAFRMVMPPEFNGYDGAARP